MLKFAADENFNGRILRGLLRRQPDLDIIRVQDTEVAGADDPTILEWAAQEERILITHDVNALAGLAYDRVRAGLPMSGVLEVNDNLPIGRAIEEILLIIEASFEDEWPN